MKKSKEIGELLGIKILDDIKKYLNKSSKPNTYNFEFVNKYRGKRYYQKNIDTLISKKKMEFLKKYKLDGIFLHVNNNSKITNIHISREFSAKNMTMKKLYIRYIKNLEKDICRYFDLTKDEFTRKYYIDSLGEHELVSSHYKFKIKKIPIILSSNIEYYPEVYGGMVHLNCSLETEEIWKGHYIKDAEYSESKNFSFD